MTKLLNLELLSVSCHTGCANKGEERKKHIKVMEWPSLRPQSFRKSVEEAEASSCQTAATTPKGFREFL